MSQCHGRGRENLPGGCPLTLGTSTQAQNFKVNSQPPDPLHHLPTQMLTQQTVEKSFFQRNLTLWPRSRRIALISSIVGERNCTACSVRRAAAHSVRQHTRIKCQTSCRSSCLSTHAHTRPLCQTLAVSPSIGLSLAHAFSPVSLLSPSLCARCNCACVPCEVCSDNTTWLTTDVLPLNSLAV